MPSWPEASIHCGRRLRSARTGASHALSLAKNQVPMLRITYARTETEQRWTLCGQLTGPWVAELRASWEYCRQVGVFTVVDLSDVTFIDESGEALLSQMRNSGAEFVAAGVDT